jgi:hypothetical protein
MLPGLSAMQYAAISAGANAASQLSQEGAAKYGINPISLGLSALSGYGAAPGAGQELAGAKIVGSSPAGSISAGELAKLQGIDSASQLGYSTDLSFLDKAQNVALGLGESSANYLGKGTDVVNKLTVAVPPELVAYTATLPDTPLMLLLISIMSAVALEHIDP